MSDALRAYAERTQEQFFLRQACFICQYYAKAAAHVKRCQAGGLRPADNGNAQCFAAGVDNGVAEAVQNNGVKTGILPVCRKLHNFGRSKYNIKGRVKLHIGVLRAHHGKLCIGRRVFFQNTAAQSHFFLRHAVIGVDN